MYESRGAAKFYYSYDANGVLYSVKYTLTDTSDLQTYYYSHNSRGDIEGIYNGNGELRAKYEYDAWGNVIEDSGEPILRKLNPLRYRGYVYDADTGLYYLQSRYYDPQTGRFINADDIAYIGASGTALSGNLFAYCENNSVNYSDNYGYWCHEICCSYCIIE